MSVRHVAAILFLPLAAANGMAASYGELADMKGQQPVTRPNAGGVYGGGNGASPGQQLYPGYSGGPQIAPGYGLSGGYAGGQPAVRYPTALPLLPAGVHGLPATRQMRWTYGQVNASSDPFNVWGLSTPHMFVPWSTPMSGWANAQTWDWWRTRAGDPGPPLPLW